jgi:acyl-CoA dehydrogenase
MSESARLLDETADRLLKRLLPETATARTAEPVRAELCRALVDSGLPLTLAPESSGGLAADLGDAAVIAWRWGYHAAPLPIVGMMLGPLVASRSGFQGEDPMILCEEGEAPVLPVAGACLALAASDAIIALNAEGGSPFRDLAGEPWRLHDLAQARGTPLAQDVAAELRTRAALLIASQMTGAMAKIVEMIIEHANTRQQFGRPLGKFQAVQNLIAEAACEQVSTQAAVDAAVAAFDHGASNDVLTHSAKAQAGRAATIVAAAAHQVLAAIGFTEEHILGHYSRRLWLWRDQWGRQSASEEALGRAAAADPRGLWPHLVD